MLCVVVWRVGVHLLHFEFSCYWSFPVFGRALVVIYDHKGEIVSRKMYLGIYDYFYVSNIFFVYLGFVSA